MSTHLYASFVSTLQELVTKLAQCNAFFDFLHIVDPDDISSTFSCQRDVHSVASTMSEFENFSLKASTSYDQPIRKLMDEMAGQLWEFPVTIRSGQHGAILRCRGRPACMSPSIRQNIQDLQSNGGLMCDTLGLVSVDKQSGLSQTLLYGLAIHLMPSDCRRFNGSASATTTFTDLCNYIGHEQVLLLKTSHDLLDFHYLPLEVNRYSIASAPAAQHPSICVQGLIPGELLTPIPLDEFMIDEDMDSHPKIIPLTKIIKILDGFNPLQYPTNDVDEAIRGSRNRTMVFPPSLSKPKRGAPKMSTRKKKDPIPTKRSDPTFLTNQQIGHRPVVSTPYQIPTAAQLYNEQNSPMASSNFVIRSDHPSMIDNDISNERKENEISIVDRVPPGNSVGLVKRIQSRIANRPGGLKTRLDSVLRH